MEVCYGVGGVLDDCAMQPGAQSGSWCVQCGSTPRPLHSCKRAGDMSFCRQRTAERGGVSTLLCSVGAPWARIVSCCCTCRLKDVFGTSDGACVVLLWGGGVVYPQ